MSLYRIGLTGSIGSGKSTVSRYLRNRGYKVFDADKIARSLTEKDSPVLEELFQAFGGVILNEAGELDRRYLAEVAFSSDENKELLSKIVTNKVKEILDKEIDIIEETDISKLDYITEKVVFFDIPLLFEYEMEKRFDEVWNVDCDREIRYRRAKERDGISREDFLQRDKAQVSPEDKLALADVTFHNDKSIDDLENKIDMELMRIEVLIGHLTI